MTIAELARKYFPDIRKLGSSDVIDHNRVPREDCEAALREFRDRAVTECEKQLALGHDAHDCAEKIRQLGGE